MSPNRRQTALPAGGVVFAALLALIGLMGPAGCGPGGGGGDATTTERVGAMSITIESEAFVEGGPIPRKYTGDGADLSPPLRWSGVPADSVELALISDDPDAPRAQPWVHWVIYKIPADTTALPEGIDPSPEPAVPRGALQGRNDFGKIGYGGPAPPKGHGVHHYHFKLYALDSALALEAGLDKKALLAAMEGHVLAWGELVGTYQR